MAYKSDLLKILSTAPQRVFSYRSHDLLSDALRDGYWTDTQFQMQDIILFTGTRENVQATLTITQAAGGIATARFTT
jgi:hypothetical protein